MWIIWEPLLIRINCEFSNIGMLDGDGNVKLRD